MEHTIETKENKMGTMPVRKLLITMSLPMMASMLVQALYNIIDSIFVSRISEDALTAVSMAFPVQALLIAVAGGTGVGVNALLSRSLGEKKFKEADRAANMGILLMIISYFFFAIFGIFAAGFFFESQVDASLPNAQAIVNYGTAYLRICLIFSFGLMLEMMLERILQATGKTFFTMITQGVGAIVNIILDPILIFGLCGLPAMGITGAAVATVTGQIIAMILAVFFNVTKNTDVSITNSLLSFPIQDVPQYSILFPDKKPWQVPLYHRKTPCRKCLFLSFFSSLMRKDYLLVHILCPSPDRARKILLFHLAKQVLSLAGIPAILFHFP